MPRLPKGSRGDNRHNPLHLQITQDQFATSKAGAPVQGRKKTLLDPLAKTDNDNGMSSDEEETGPQSIDPRTSSKILSLARKQQDEEEGGDQEEEDSRTLPKGSSIGRASAAIKKKTFEEEDDDEETFGHEEDYDAEGAYDELNIDIDDAALIDQFMHKETAQKQTLADLIFAKLKEGEEARDGEQTKASLERSQAAEDEINPKVVQVYEKVGSILSRYRSGPLPKAFKIIPSLKNWEEILFLTAPYEWSPQAVYQATRIFVSNLKDKMAQRFFSLVLLDKVREDIAQTKKLNYHLYMALKKGLYKPAAFFKGFLFPLCELGNCSLREAAIIGSVLTKVSVPVLHSAAALLKIAEMEYTGPNSLFIRILLDKKYALPFKVIDALVFHFLRFKSEQDREMPVLWHQSLLVFCQRYKEDMTPDQKEAILDLIKAKGHEGITPDIRRELVQSACRGEMKTDDGVDAMELEL